MRDVGMESTLIHPCACACPLLSRETASVGPLRQKSNEEDTSERMKEDEEGTRRVAVSSLFLFMIFSCLLSLLLAWL